MVRVDMEFLFECSTRWLTSKRSQNRLVAYTGLFLHISFIRHYFALYVNYAALCKSCFTSLKAMCFIFAWMCTMCLVISSRFIFSVLFVSIFLIKFVFLVLTNFLLLHMRIKGKLSWMPSKRNWLERAHASSILYSSFVNQNICAFFNTWKW